MAEPAGLTTFVGRVRGTLTAEDAAWIERTSAAIESVRSGAIDASARLAVLEREVGGGSAPEGAETNTPVDPTWEQVVAWAAAVNAALVEVAARRRLPGSFDAGTTAAVAAEQAATLVGERSVELGQLLQSLRGEQVVDELLSAGILVAPPGATGSLAFQDHGAWDIEFLGSGGHTIARADVLITNDPSEILTHLSTRPGVDLIYTTSDAADGLDGSDQVAVIRPGDAWPVDAEAAVVVDVGSDTSALHAELTEVFDAAGAEGSADALFEAVPVLALLLVGARAAARAATTVDPGSDIATTSWQQTKDVVATAGVSELVGWASGLNLIKVPVTLTFALSRSAVRDARSSVELSGRRVARARKLLAGVGVGG